MKRRLLLLASALGAITFALGVFVGLDREDTATASPTLRAAAEEATPTQAVREAIRTSLRAPKSPLAPDAESGIAQLFTPADGGLPAFFTVPTRDGGKCIVTSFSTIGSCMRTGETKAGTISVFDESEADERPPFIYGQTARSVKSVTVTVEGTKYLAGIAPGFYLLKLPSPSFTVDSVESVTFTLTDGSEITREL